MNTKTCMKVRNNPILHLDTNQSKGTVLLLLFYTDTVDSSTMGKPYPKMSVKQLLACS